MLHTISKYIYASCNELGTANGGKCGDQNGKEVKIAQAYNFGQTTILRFEDKKIVKKLLSIAEVAAKNDNIGYGQNHRYELVNYTKEGHKIANCKRKRCCDCSSLITSIMYELGFLDFNYWSYTMTLENDFRKICKSHKLKFKILTYDANKVKKGDILLNPKTHVAIAYM